MRPSIFIIKSDPQKVMGNFGFGCRFHDLKIFEVDFLFIIILEFIINLRTTLQSFVEKHYFYFFLSYLKKILDNYVFNKPVSTIF